MDDCPLNRNLYNINTLKSIAHSLNLVSLNCLTRKSMPPICSLRSVAKGCMSFRTVTILRAYPEISDECE